ncbi:serine/threonine protein kinase [Cypionkella sp.]|uniref:serine/threonine protein kinase n=1 Tax=Cypionkella sp. TaxID=2811411 RepID=UPI002625A4B8|nr:serine/threonine protein kinase [Cypionkella sp.]MDB5665882.1 serine/threonine protein kinase [Cypionkella sp.]
MTNNPTNPGIAAEPPRERATTVSGGTRIIGTYEIDKLISAGGMGEVYRGHNIHNGEPVAIKIVLPSLAHDPKIVALFQKESTTLSRLSHEAIVRYHVFTNDPIIGRPCLVMEFVSGTPVSDRIEQGPMPADDVRVMLRRVASGLDKAHRAGVVHRDMSPDNIILEEGLVEHAKLIDFGIAKSSAIGAGTLLQGQFAGKFNWVAPEQLGAFGGHVDGRSDIYSLALVAAAASKGAVLPMGDSIVDAVGKRAAVPDLSGVDAGLVPLLQWMLSPDPDARPATMAQVIAALDNPALVPAGKTSLEANATIIGGVLPVLGASDASPFGNVVAAPSVSAATPAKRSLILPLAVAVIVATSGVAYFSGAFNSAPSPEPETVADVPIAEPVKPAVLTAATLTNLLAQAQDCGPLSATNPPADGYAEGDAVRINGRVGSEATISALKVSLAPAVGKRALELDLEPLNRQICSVLNALPSVGSGGFTVSLGYGDSADPNPDGMYTVGQNPVIDVAMPAVAGYVSAVVVDGSGHVLHLLANRKGGEAGTLQVASSVAEAIEGGSAFVVNNAGLAMVLVVQSEAPLSGDLRMEPVADFIQRLKVAKLVSVDERLMAFKVR